MLIIAYWPKLSEISQVDISINNSVELDEQARKIHNVAITIPSEKMNNESVTPSKVEEKVLVKKIVLISKTKKTQKNLKSETSVKVVTQKKA